MKARASRVLFCERTQMTSRWSIGAAMIVVAGLVAAACGKEPGSPSQPMYDQFDRDWQYWSAQYPEGANALGVKGGEDRWTDYSADAIAARATYLRESLDRIKFVDRATLGEPDQLNYDLYRQMLDVAVAGLDLQNDAAPIRGVIPRNLMMPINQMEGMQQDIPRTIAMMPGDTPANLAHIIARLKGVPAVVDQTIALMRQGLAEKMTPPRIALRDVPGQVLAQVVDNPLASPMLAAFTKRPAGVPEGEWPALVEQAATAYRQQVATAFRRLHAFLVDEYLPACRETTGANALPRGDALYQYNAQWHTTTTKTPKEIHDIGLAEVARIRAEMEKIIATAGYGNRFDDFVRFLRTDRRFYYTSADALVSGYRDIGKRADPELAKLFGRLPQTPWGLAVIPAAIAPSQTTAYYEPGAFVAGRPGYMFANTYKLDARPKYEMEALTMHEAVPGHHLQIALAQELTGLPEFRKHSSYTAYVEGWALYAERLGEQMGFYTDPYSKFGQLTYEMWRAVRLVVDTGLHSMGWTRQQAIDYFLKNTAKTQQDITVEVDRYIVWPGQALGYKMGEIKIRELRATAESMLGAAFDIRGFHDEILASGAVPLDVVDARIKAWIERQKQR
jgi:uncharacterized protein (DUF885 family)